MHTVLYPVNELKVGGAEQQLLALVRGLDKERFHPIVAPLYPNGPLTDEFTAIPGAEVLDLNRRDKYDPSPLWRLARVLRTRPVDVVQPFLSPSTFFGLLPALVVGGPATVVTERCGVRLVRHLGYRVYQRVEDWLTRFADVVVANSMAGSDLLRGRGIHASKIRVIHNGIDSARLAADPAQVSAAQEMLGGAEGEVVGIFAGLTPAKDHRTFLRAMARLAATRPGLRCAIVGDGPLRAELETLTATLGVADRVVFCGSQRQVGGFLAACDLVVSSSCDNEGCSNSILEAMGVGAPVVATDVGGTRELIDDGVTGFLVPPRDPRALAAAVERVLGDRCRAKSVALRGKMMVRDGFGLDHMVQQYERLYTRLLGSTASNRRPTESAAGAPRLRDGAFSLPIAAVSDWGELGK